MLSALILDLRLPSRQREGARYYARGDDKRHGAGARGASNCILAPSDPDYPAVHCQMVIFVSSVGRSGTRYLADLFSHCTDVDAEHAAEPVCNGEIMIDIYNGIDRPEVSEKAGIIKARVAERGAYFESTQLFNRVLAPTFLDHFPSVSVIHMLRDPLEVACSYINRRSYPGHPNRPWRMPLNLERSLFRFPQPLTPLQENLCDWLENELRFAELEPRLDRVVEFSFANLESVEHLCAMFEGLGVAYRREDVIHHTTRKDLERNANRRRTRISRKSRRQSEDLVGILAEHGFPTAVFRRECYAAFDFCRLLAAS